jgi:hypothetical protein
LQPLDVSVFGPFQCAWIEQCEEIIEDTGEEMSRSDFVREYMAVRQDAFKEKILLQAWKKSGAWPINPSVFTDDDFALSVMVPLGLSLLICIVLGFCCGATCPLTFTMTSDQYDHGVVIYTGSTSLFCLSGFEQLYDC